MTIPIPMPSPRIRLKITINSRLGPLGSLGGTEGVYIENVRGDGNHHHGVITGGLTYPTLDTIEIYHLIALVDKTLC